MKKAKIMLLTIAVIATVGTALAFKVNNRVSTDYCFLATSTQPSTGGCTSELIQNPDQLQKFNASSPVNFFYTVKSAACNTLACPNAAKEIINE